MALIADTGSSNSIAGATPRQINSSTSLVVPTFSAVAYSHVRVTDNQVESSGTARDQHGARPAYSGSGGYAWYPHSEPSP